MSKLYSLFFVFFLTSCFTQKDIKLLDGLSVLRRSMKNVTENDRAMIAYGNLLAQEIGVEQFSESEISFLLEGFEAGLRNPTKINRILDSSKVLRRFHYIIEEKKDLEREKLILKNKKKRDVLINSGYKEIENSFLYKASHKSKVKSLDSFFVEIRLKSTKEVFSYRVSRNQLGESLEKLYNLIGLNHRVEVFSQRRHIPFLYFSNKSLNLYFEYSLRFLEVI